MERKRVADAARIKMGYVVIPNYGEPVGFHTLKGVKEYVRKMGVGEFYAYDVDNEDNTVRIKSEYMDRYRESDIEDRLMANKQQGGEGFFVQRY